MGSWSTCVAVYAGHLGGGPARRCVTVAVASRPLDETTATVDDLPRRDETGSAIVTATETATVIETGRGRGRGRERGSEERGRESGKGRGKRGTDVRDEGRYLQVLIGHRHANQGLCVYISLYIMSYKQCIIIQELSKEREERCKSHPQPQPPSIGQPLS